MQYDSIVSHSFPKPESRQYLRQISQLSCMISFLPRDRKYRRSSKPPAVRITRYFLFLWF